MIICRGYEISSNDNQMFIAGYTYSGCDIIFPMNRNNRINDFLSYQLSRISWIIYIKQKTHKPAINKILLSWWKSSKMHALMEIFTNLKKNFLHFLVKFFLSCAFCFTCCTSTFNSLMIASLRKEREMQGNIFWRTCFMPMEI